MVFSGLPKTAEAFGSYEIFSTLTNWRSGIINLNIRPYIEFDLINIQKLDPFLNMHFIRPLKSLYWMPTIEVVKDR